MIYKVLKVYLYCWLALILYVLFEELYYYEQITGTAVPLVYENKEGNFESNIDEIEKILMNPEIKDLKVAVISIVGKYRRGKSFLLNFFLRYLNSKTNGKNLDCWMGSDYQELEGFKWKVQSERVTTGILIWSKIFVTELNNEKIAIILVDTQGTVDDEHTMAEQAKLFGMVTLMSSFQIYNVMRDIEEDELQALTVYTKRAENFLKSWDVKVGQKLQILVRDWSYPFEFPYGSKGGKLKLEKKLSTENRKPEFVKVRLALKSSFDDISCYLMPSPGADIISNPNSTGKLSAMDETFVKYLKEYVPFVLSEENLTLKKFNEEPITVADFVHLIRYYQKILNQTDDSESENISEVRIPAALKVARKRVINIYDYFSKVISRFFDEPESEKLQGKYDSHLNEITNYYHSLKNRVRFLFFEKPQNTESKKILKYSLTIFSTLAGALVGGPLGAAAGGGFSYYLIDRRLYQKDDDI